MSTGCIFKYKPYLTFHFCFSSLCSSVKAYERLACPAKLIALGQQFQPVLNIQLNAIHFFF